MNMAQLAHDAGLERPRRFAVDWARAEAEIGTALPADYKEFVYWFGPGTFDDYLHVCVPGIANGNVELADFLRQETEILQGRADKSGTPEPFPVFPEARGLLPWGGTSNGDILYWQVDSSDPDSWKVVGRPGRGADYGRFSGTFGDFIHAFVWDTVDLHFIAETETEPPIPFDPDDGSWPGTGRPAQESYGYFESE